MQYCKLGRTDMEISKLCLGTMTFGVQTSEEDAFEQMDMAFDAGINCLDTAELYPVLPISKETQGESERIMGRWMKVRNLRDRVFVFSKVAGINSTSTKDGQAIDGKDVRRGIERSLVNLQTDCIDLYQLHWPNRGHYSFRNIWNYHVAPENTGKVVDNLVDTIETLNALQNEGKIKAYGVSNETAWGTMKMLEISNMKDLIRLSSIQQEYSLLNRLFEPDLQEIGLREDVSLLTYSSLAGGMLTGKYGLNGNVIPAGSRRSIEANMGGRVNEIVWRVIEKYLELAKDAGIDPVHFAYRFCLSQNFVSSVIVGATNKNQMAHILKDNYDPLPNDVLARIAEIRREYPMPI